MVALCTGLEIEGGWLWRILEVVEVVVRCERGKLKEEENPSKLDKNEDILYGKSNELKNCALLVLSATITILCESGLAKHAREYVARNDNYLVLSALPKRYNLLISYKISVPITK